MTSQEKLSTELGKLERQIADQEWLGGAIMDADTCRQLSEQLRDCKRRARQMEDEIADARWRDEVYVALGSAGQQREAAILAEAARPGTNLRLLGPMERPL